MNNLVTTAIVGTGQQVPDTLVTGTPVDTLAAQLPQEQRERALLLAAGAQAVYRQAGYQPLQILEIPQPAPDETSQTCSQQVGFLLDTLFKGGHQTQLIPEALARLHMSKRRLPHELLPWALTYGAEHKAVREALIPVLGERGRWISQFNPKWAWVQQFLAETSNELPADAETIWQEGTIGQRCEILRRLRFHDAEKAREWLKEVWKAEKAETRATFLSTLEVNLSANDEAFLESTSNERSVNVRIQAVSLLARIPGSALGQRMQARADALIDYKKGKLIFHPLQELDNHWKEDGLPGEAAQKPEIFNKAFEQIIGLIPPNHWTERFGATVDALLGALKHQGVPATLLDAWIHATCLHQSQEWAGPLLKRLLRKNQTTMIQELLQLLEQQEAEQELLQVSFENVAGSNALDMLPHPWSDQFGREYLQKLRDHLNTIKKKKSTSYYHERGMDSIALNLPYACFEQAYQLEELHEENPQHWSLTYLNERLNTFLETLKMRKRIIEEIN